MMYNPQIQRLHGFHRPPAQAHAASFGELCKPTPLPICGPLKGRSHDVMSAFGTKRTSRAGLPMSVDWGRPEVAGGASNQRD
jgi:hypothetical protein